MDCSAVKTMCANKKVVRGTCEGHIWQYSTVLYRTYRFIFLLSWPFIIQYIQVDLFTWLAMWTSGSSLAIFLTVPSGNRKSFSAFSDLSGLPSCKYKILINFKLSSLQSYFLDFLKIEYIWQHCLNKLQFSLKLLKEKFLRSRSIFDRLRARL